MKFPQFKISPKIAPYLILLLVLAIPVTMTAISSGKFTLQNRAASVEEKSPASAKPPEYVPGEVIVKFKKPLLTNQSRSITQITNLKNLSNKSPKILLELRKKYGQATIGNVFQTTSTKNINKGPSAQSEKVKQMEEGFKKVYKLTLEKSESVPDIVNKLKNDSSVEYAEPNYIYKIDRLPNDPDFTKQWGLHNNGQSSGTADADIDAPEAWDIATSSNDVIVAVVDTGVDYNHVDLIGNIWINQVEKNGKNGSDDDGNGYIDDIYGCGTINAATQMGLYACSSVLDDAGHGSHVAGIIGAKTNNNTGVAGVNWNTKIMAVKFLNQNGSGATDDAVAGIKYAVENGAQILSNSWGGGGYSNALVETIEYANLNNVLFVAAAGNSSSNNDLYPQYPSDYDVNNIISVAATDKNDRLASFSNYGIKNVDIAGPGVGIFSTWKDGGYNTISGTSMATPFISGVGALMLNNNKSLTAKMVKQILLSTTDSLSDLAGFTVSGGRINARNALQPDNFVAYPGEINIIQNRDQTITRKILLSNNGLYEIDWQASLNSDANWLKVSKLSGKVLPEDTDEIVIELSSKDLDSGSYSTTLNIKSVSPESISFDVDIKLTVRLNYWGEDAVSIGGTLDDEVGDAQLDSNGNVYQIINTNSVVNINGTDYGQNSDAEILLIKRNSDNQIIWVKQLGNAAGNQIGSDLAIDSENNIYLSGKFANAIKADEIEVVGNNNLMPFVAKLDLTGKILWLRSLNETTDFNTKVVVSPFDSGRGTYIVNYAVGSFNDLQYFLVGFDSTGAEIWRKSVPRLNDLIIGTNGKIYGTGSIPLIIFDSNGNEILRDENINRFGQGLALAKDDDDTIYLTGTLDILVSPNFNPQDRDILVAKYLQQGQKIWDKRFYGPIGEESGRAIVVDKNKNIHVTGNYAGDIYIDGSKFTSGVNSQDDIFMTSLDQQGRLLSFYSIGNSTYSDKVSNILVDDLGKLRIFGSYKSHIIVERQRLYSKGSYDSFMIILRPDRPFTDFKPSIGSGKAVYITSGGYIELDDALNKLLLFPKGTIEFWLNAEVSTKQPQTILYRERTTAEGAWIDIRHAPNSLNQYKDTYIYYTAWRPDRTFPLNRWVHIAFVRDGKNLTFYLNGLKHTVLDLGTEETIPQHPSSTFKIGAQQISDFGTNLGFQGAIDELRISDIKRDVEKLWNNGEYFRLFNKDENTIGLWQFDDNLVDSSNNEIQIKRSKSTTFINGIVGNMLSPSPTPTQTATPTPTPTKKPTNTPPPTKSPTPTAVPKPTRTPTPLKRKVTSTPTSKPKPIKPSTFLPF